MNRSSFASGLLLVAGAAALALAFRYTRGGAGVEEEPPPATDFRFPVTTVAVEQGIVREWAPLVGDVLSSRRTPLAFERPGRVAEVGADLGDSLPAGALLARLDDAVLEEQLAAARAAAEAAGAEAENAAREAHRAREVGPDVVPENERERLETLAHSGASRRDQAAAEVRRLEALLQQGRLVSPFACVVSARHVTLGSHVQAGAPAFEVVDMEHREVHLEVPAAVAAVLAPAAPVQIEADELAGTRLEARVDALVPAADPGSRSFTAVVRLDLDGPGARRLLPGMFVRARVLRREAAGLVVPADSLLRGGSGTAVVVAVDGGDGELPPRARFVPVRVLARNDERAALEALEPGGLDAGLEVVLAGVDNVFPGAPLAPRAAGGETPAGAGAQ